MLFLGCPPDPRVRGLRPITDPLGFFGESARWDTTTQLHKFTYTRFASAPLTLRGCEPLFLPPLWGKVRMGGASSRPYSSPPP